MGVMISHGTKTDETVNQIEFWTLHLYSFLQYFQAVNQHGLCTGRRGFGSESVKQIKMASAQETEGLILTDGGSAKSNYLIF